jgi:hypothetical protein
MDSELCTNSDFVIHPGAQQIYLALVCFKRIERGMKGDISDLSSTTDHNINNGIQDIYTYGPPIRLPALGLAPLTVPTW